MDILRLESDSTTYSLVLKIKLSTDAEGLHQVTLPREEKYFLSEDDVLGIHDDVSYVNSLRYLDLTSDLLSVKTDYAEQGAIPSQHYGYENLTSDLQYIPLTAATNSSDVAPIAIHLDQGNPFWHLPCRQNIDSICMLDEIENCFINAYFSDVLIHN